MDGSHEVVVNFRETWLTCVDGTTTTDAKLDVITGVDDASTKDDVSFGGDDVRIIIDDGVGADDDNDVMIDDIMILDVFSLGDGCAKIKKQKEMEMKNHFHPAICKLGVLLSPQ